MTEAERISLLINALEGGTGAAFANRIGLSVAQVSKIKNGRNGIGKHINTILKAYPVVNRSWLETGEGYPGDLTVDLVKAQYEEKLKRSDTIIDNLVKRIEDLERQIEVQNTAPVWSAK